MKKRKLMVMFINTLMALCPLVSCSHTCSHIWEEATCEKPQTCSLCKEEKGEKLGHSYVDGKCSRCGKIDENYVEPIVSFALEEKKKEITKYRDCILNNVDDTLGSSINNIFESRLNEIEKAKTIIDINRIADECIKEIQNIIPLANGEFDYSSISENEKKEALVLLDDYIFRNNLGGIATSRYRTLNLNSTTKEQWIKFFGEEGSVYQTSKDKYWEVKPFLSNRYFLKGLSLSLPKEDEEEINETSFYKIDYSKYDFYKYDKELASKYFALAVKEMDMISPSLEEEKLNIELEIAFGTKTEQNELTFNSLKNNIESAFNEISVSEGKIVLEVKPWYGITFSEIYSKKNYNGQFDLSYDKISGSSYDELMDYKLLSSSKQISNGLTINWSIDTNNIEDDCIVFKGKRFTYDSLISLLEGTQTISKGAITFGS